MNHQFLGLEKNLVIHHHLQGYYASCGQSQFKSDWFEQWRRNEILLGQLHELDLRCEGIEVIAMKGIALVETIYEDKGSRRMNDIDLFIKKDHFESVFNILQQMGYATLDTHQWWGDIHKKVLTKVVDGLEVVFELHQKIFFHLDFDVIPAVSSFSGYKNLKVFRLEEHLVYLCGHYGFQHTFLKLFWLLDIHLLIHKNLDIDWKRVAELSKRWKLLKSVRLTLGLLENFGAILPTEAKITLPPMKPFYMHSSVYLHGKRNIYYYLMKHFSKDSILTSLKYDLLWPKYFLQTFFGKKDKPDKHLQQEIKK